MFRLTDEPFEIRLAEDDRFEGLLGRSVAMRELFAICARVALTEAPVIIWGETGTGKELVARAIHERSRARATGRSSSSTAAAIPPGLIESELFGHEKGAFTGATAARAGAFERADGGTVFLDELGELPLELQPKLLRVLESGEVTPRRRRPAAPRRRPRDRGDAPRPARDDQPSGRFREDLYYRLAVIRSPLPPLRERREDIPLLAAHFASELLGEAARAGAAARHARRAVRRADPARLAGQRARAAQRGRARDDPRRSGAARRRRARDRRRRAAALDREGACTSSTRCAPPAPSTSAST